MPMTCRTVCVVSPESPGGYKVINETDVTSEHEIWTAEKAVSIETKTVNDGAAKRDRHHRIFSKESNT